MGNDFGRTVLGVLTLGLSELIPAIGQLTRRSQRRMNELKTLSDNAGTPKEAAQAMKKCRRIMVDSMGEAADTYRSNATVLRQDKTAARKPVIVVAGQVCCGKTTFVNKGLGTNEKAAPVENTMGYKVVNQNRYRRVTVQDMFGVSDAKFLENFAKIVDLCRLDAVIFIYESSLANNKFLLETIVASKVPVVCVRNKMDQVEREYWAMVENTEKGQAKSLGVKAWMPASARSGKGVDEVFRLAVRLAEGNFNSK